MVECQPDDKLLFDPMNFEYSASLAPGELTLVYAVIDYMIWFHFAYLMVICIFDFYAIDSSFFLKKLMLLFTH